MKTLVITLALVIYLFMAEGVSAATHTNGNPVKSKEKVMKAAMDKQVSKHLFHPLQGKEQGQGSANVMLRVMPRGDVQVVTIKSDNPHIQKFVENQVRKMKIPANEVVVGQLFKYQLVFKKQ